MNPIRCLNKASWRASLKHIQLQPLLVVPSLQNQYRKYSTHSIEANSNARPTKLLKGKPVADEILNKIKLETELLKTKSNVQPSLVIIVVGINKQIEAYVRMKQLACERVGFLSTVDRFHESCSEHDVLEKVKMHSENPLVHGIIVQLPLPSHINPSTVVSAVSPQKDVDGLHPTNLGQLMFGYYPKFLPCTPAAILSLLSYYNIPILGKHITVVGRSGLVGRPIANLLSMKHTRDNTNSGATVTLTHKDTMDLSFHTLLADILVVATGSPALIKPSMVKKDAVIVDVGVNFIEDKTHPKGGKLVGDVHHEVYEKCSLYTPVPGGIGPITVAKLLQNVWISANNSVHKPNSS
eukprot:TRINITY_DN4961_c0_g1_i1.p1 TRINITY_DN4961_c0_g1~~TRINITY_DN4961_c0_g1_i1.p1  ORF type:complete len:352 (-),score=65.36 TRINITY_DN4961_c0_g1_i1:101-1156(-)